MIKIKSQKPEMVVFNSDSSNADESWADKKIVDEVNKKHFEWEDYHGQVMMAIRNNLPNGARILEMIYEGMASTEETKIKCSESLKLKEAVTSMDLLRKHIMAAQIISDKIESVFDKLVYETGDSSILVRPESESEDDDI